MSKTFNTTHATFNLQDFIANIANTDIAASLAQSYAWRIDTLIQGHARQLFKNVRQDQFTKNVDGIAELSMALAQQAFAEHAFEEAGSTTIGPVTAIKELMLQRDSAHALAEELTQLTSDWQGNTRSYVAPDLDDMFFQEVNLKIKPMTKRRIAVSVKRAGAEYDMTKEEIDAQVATRIAREEDKLADISTTVQNQAGGVHAMFTLACRSDVSGEVGAHFHSMDIATQRVLITSVMEAAARAESDATSNSNITDAEFDSVCFTVMKINKDLKAVLASPKFKAQAQQQQATEHNVG